MDSDPLAVNPGGVPIFYQNVVVGGIGVVTSSSDLNVAEYAAFVGSKTQRTGPSDSFGPTPAAPGAISLNGVTLPFVNQTTLPAGLSAGPVAGGGSYLVAPTNSVGQPPEGDLIPPAAGPLGGLSAADVQNILDNAEATADVTRAAIRLPIGARARMTIAVADLASETGLPLGVVQILLSDLHQQGLISVVRPANEHTNDETVLKKVLDGLRSL